MPLHSLSSLPHSSSSPSILTPHHTHLTAPPPSLTAPSFPLTAPPPHPSALHPLKRSLHSSALSCTALYNSAVFYTTLHSSMGLCTSLGRALDSSVHLWRNLCGYTQLWGALYITTKASDTLLEYGQISTADMENVPSKPSAARVKF